MNRALLVMVAVVAGASTGGCRNPFSPSRSVILNVSEISAPASVAAGAPISVVLTVMTGGCVSFDHIETHSDASGASITAWGDDTSGGSKNVACPQDIRYEQHSLRFDPPFASTFNVWVNRGRLSPLTATVQVQ
jgi:hypothetical protein